MHRLVGSLGLWCVACSAGGGVRGGGDGVLRAHASWVGGAVDATDLTWADDDGDGDLDLAVSVDGAPSAVFHNDGGLAQVWDTAADDPARAVAWADADGDGRLELAFGHGNETSFGVRLPIPDRVYGPDRALQDELIGFVDAAMTRDMAWSDVDGDGVRELVVVRATYLVPSYVEPGSIEVFDGEPGARFSAFRTDDVSAHALDLADRDGDGDLDLAVGTDTGVAVYDNDGSGRFELALEAAILAPVTGVAWHDTDGDGVPELAAGGFGGTALLTVSADALTEVWRTETSRTVAWGDVDGDGNPDLVAGGRSGLAAYRTDGVEVWRAADAGDVRALAWADVDGDGDDDLTVAEAEGPVRIYPDGTLGWGLQIAAEGGPGPQTVVVRGGTPGAHVALMLGTGPGVTPLPVCGAVDITGVRATATTTIDADGLAVFTPTLPRAAAGTTIWLDAVESGGCRGAAPFAWEVGLGSSVELAAATLDGDHVIDVAMPGDLSGDGVPDLGLADYGADEVALYSGGTRGPDGAPFAHIASGEGATPVGLAGPGDVDGDGFADLWVSDDDGAHLLHGPFVGDHTTAEASVAVRGPLRSAIRYLPEIGDGGAVVLWAWEGYGDPAGDGGGVAIWSETAPGDYTLADAAFVLREPSERARAGDEAAHAGDLDGDGLSDLIVGAPTTSPLGARGGAAYLVRAPFVDGDLPDLAIATLTSGTDSAQVGEAVAGDGDLDGDGTPEVAVLTLRQGVRVVTGDAEGLIDTDHAALRLEGEALAAAGGGALTLADVDGDGFDDLVVGAPPPSLGFGFGHGHLERPPPPDPIGGLYILYGPASGVVDLDDREHWRGPTDDTRLGVAVAVGDVDGDGRDDVLASMVEGAALILGEAR